MPSGRKKPAPQPLSLHDPSKATAQNHSRDYYNVSTDPDATSSTASGLSPIDSRSPNSGGTSPSFRSKFATKKRPQTAKSGSNNPEVDPHNDYHRPSHPSLDPLNQPEAPPFSPITSILDQPKGPPLRQPTHESKKSKSGGLFHFSKSSRTHNQLPTHPPPPQQQPNPRYQTNQIGPSETNFASGPGGKLYSHSWRTRRSIGICQSRCWNESGSAQTSGRKGKEGAHTYRARELYLGRLIWQL